MHKKGKINKKQSRGITLIALVITIIVLLILAGVTINTLFDNGNAIDKAAEARDETNKANIKEQLDLAVITSRINDNNANINTDKLKSELEKLKNTGIIGEYEPSGEDFKLPCTVTKDNYEFTIDEDGNVTAKNGQTPPSGGGTLTDEEKKERAAAANEKIGQTVAYGDDITDYNGGWRVYYASEEEMFLIAANVISFNGIPTKGYTNSDDVFSAKNAASDSGYSYSNVTYGAKYNSKWKTQLKGATNTNYNSLATAYLCDPKNWTEYISPTAPNGTYAVGGPTKELLALSWEAAGYNAQWSENINDDVVADGYLYIKPAGLYYGNPIKKTILPKTPGEEDGLYNTGTTYWLASPSSSRPRYVCLVDSYGYVGNYDYNIRYGVRPIVSIPISNVQIGEDGTVTVNCIIELSKNSQVKLSKFAQFSLCLFLDIINSSFQKKEGES